MVQEHRVDEEYEITRPHTSGRIYKYFIDYKIGNAIKKLPFSITGKRLLDLCCGSGMISEIYANQGAKVTGCDYDEDAILRANERKKRYAFKCEFSKGDAEKLLFSNKAFDIAAVHDGLHHLKNPHYAIKEMCRLSREAIIIIEPAQSFVTRIAVLLGISTDYEGEDYVYRFEKGEIVRLLKIEGFKILSAKRYLMYYPHQPGRIFKIADLPLIFPIIKLCFLIVNALFGYLGNKIQIVAVRNSIVT